MDAVLPTALIPHLALAQETSGADLSKLVDTWITLSGQFNERLIATVYWALGAIGGFILLLVGFSWFTNYRVYERDKTALFNELKSEISGHMSKMQVAAKDAQAVDMKTIADQLQASLSAKMETVTNRVATAEASLKTMKADMHEMAAEVKLEFEEIEAERWEKSGVRANALGCWARICKISIQTKNEYKTDEAIENIERLLRLDTPRTSWDQPVMEALEKLPSKYAPTVRRITDLIAKG